MRALCRTGSGDALAMARQSQLTVAFVLLDGEVTGGQVVAHQLMQGLRERGHAALAVFPREGPMADRVRADGFPVLVLPLDRTYRLDQALALARALRRSGATVVHAHTLFVGTMLVRAASLLARLPLVEHVHIEERFSTRPAAALVQRLLARATSGIPRATIVVSGQVELAALGLGARPGRVSVIHNGVRVGPAEPPPHGQGSLRLACVARLAPVKGQEVLIDALALAGPGIEADLAGDDLEQGGAYRRALELRAADRGVAGQLRFLGRCDDVPSLLRSADALVLPSYDEGLPLVALEAFAQARTVVASAVGGLPELVADGQNGLLCPPGSADPGRGPAPAPRRARAAHAARGSGACPRRRGLRRGGDAGADAGGVPQRRPLTGAVTMA